MLPINDFELEGLLDSGANISALGKDAIQIFNQLNVKYTKVQSKVSTSDGTENSIIGCVTLSVKYKHKTKGHKFFKIV